MKKEKGRIVRCGMGGFLNPPTHPEHIMHVETDLRRKPENRGGMSLSLAAVCEYLDDDIRKETQAMLDDWNASKPSVDDPRVQDWILNVLEYFHGCYQGKNAEGLPSWNAGELQIDNRNPMLNVDLHAGVHLIRDYYPEFVPTAAHFLNAYWGKKPDQVVPA